MKTILTMTSALTMLAFPVLAQTALSPAEDDLPEAKKTCSPHVERTLRNRNFAEGVFAAALRAPD